MENFILKLLDNEIVQVITRLIVLFFPTILWIIASYLANLV